MARPRVLSNLEEGLEDPVAVDAKRILLRYGAPITVLDDVPEAKRIERGSFLRNLLKEEGFIKEKEG